MKGKGRILTGDERKEEIWGRGAPMKGGQIKTLRLFEKT